MAGKPRRPPERVKEIYQICLSCPDDKYDSELKTPFGIGGCVECECHITDDPTSTVAKNVWPHESCPLKHWFAEVRNVKDD